MQDVDRLLDLALKDAEAALERVRQSHGRYLQGLPLFEESPMPEPTDRPTLGLDLDEDLHAYWHAFGGRATSDTMVLVQILREIRAIRRAVEGPQNPALAPESDGPPEIVPGPSE